ncbi:MAG: hypothetical protein JST82_11025 [Bacteroidetes bacterium]|nr:hypothetical protein [Bacteroidota bacterium]
MKKLCITICALLLLSSQLYAQADKQTKASVKTAVKKMNDALVKKNFKEFTKTTYPRVVEMTPGGMEKIIADLDAQIQSREKQGNKILSAWPGEATGIVDTAGELQCTIPQYMKVKLDNGILTTQTTLMAFSPDKGKTWYFIDATDKPLNEWRKIFPNISSKLIIRAPQEPKFEPNR